MADNRDWQTAGDVFGRVFALLGLVLLVLFMIGFAGSMWTGTGWSWYGTSRARSGDWLLPTKAEQEQPERRDVEDVSADVPVITKSRRRLLRID